VPAGLRRRHQLLRRRLRRLLRDYAALLPRPDRRRGGL